MTAPESAEATASDAPADDAPESDAPESDAPESDAPESDATGTGALSATPATPVEGDALAVFDDEPEAQWAGAASGGTPLTWVDPVRVAEETTGGSLDESAGTASGTALLKDARLRPAIARPGVLVPLGVLVGLVAS